MGTRSRGRLRSTIPRRNQRKSVLVLGWKARPFMAGASVSDKIQRFSAGDVVMQFKHCPCSTRDKHLVTSVRKRCHSVFIGDVAEPGSLSGAFRGHQERVLPRIPKSPCPQPKAAVPPQFSKVQGPCLAPHRVLSGAGERECGARDAHIRGQRSSSCIARVRLWTFYLGISPI